MNLRLSAVTAMPWVSTFHTLTGGIPRSLPRFQSLHARTSHSRRPTLKVLQVPVILMFVSPRIMFLRGSTQKMTTKPYKHAPTSCHRYGEGMGSELSFRGQSGASDTHFAHPGRRWGKSSPRAVTAHRVEAHTVLPTSPQLITACHVEANVVLPAPPRLVMGTRVTAHNVAPTAPPRLSVGTRVTAHTVAPTAPPRLVVGTRVGAHTIAARVDYNGACGQDASHVDRGHTSVTATQSTAPKPVDNSELAELKRQLVEARSEIQRLQNEGRPQWYWPILRASRPTPPPIAMPSLRPARKRSCSSSRTWPKLVPSLRRPSARRIVITARSCS